MRLKVKKLASAICLSTISASLILSGCNGSSSSNSTPVPPPSPVITGKVTDGPNNPIRNAQVILYSASANGPIKLGESTSNNNGEFSISYTLPASGRYVYIVAQGGSISGSNNPNINLVNVIGSQGNIPSHVVIDELTTVVSYQSFTHDWTSTTNPTLLQTDQNTSNLEAGFSTYQSLVNPVTGDFTYQYPSTSPTGGQLVAQANTLALCVQDANNCASLSNYYQTAPHQDTFTLMSGLKLANSTALISTNALLNSSSTLPYQPLTPLQQTALSIIYSGTDFNFDAPYGITSDKSGNIWITNAGHNGLTEIKNTSNSALSVELYNATSYDLGDNPFGIAADKDGNIWVANHSINTVTELELNPDGTYTPHVFDNNAGYAFASPYYLTSDSEGNIWVTNNQNYTVTEIEKNQSGGYSPVIKNNLNVPMGIAADQDDNIWVAESVGAAVTALIKNQNYAPVRYDGSTYAFDRPYGVTVDNEGNIWVANNNGDSVTELEKNSGYSPLIYNNASTPSPYTFNDPMFLKADFGDSIWVTNNNGNSVTEIVNTSNGRVPHLYDNSSYGFNGATGIAIDKAGNIWVTNANNNTVTEIIN